MGTLYLIHVREFLNKGENVFKVGRTENLTQRMSQYPKGSKLLFCMDAIDCRKAENEVISILAQDFKLRRDLGREYIEGDLERIIETIYQYIKHHNHTPLPTTLMQQDPSELISAFIDELHAATDLSCKLLKGKEFHKQFQQWLDNKYYNVDIKHALYLRILRKIYGVREVVASFDSKPEFCVQFPSNIFSAL